MKQLVLTTELKWLSKSLKAKSQEFLMSQVFLAVSKKTILSESQYKMNYECAIVNAFKKFDIDLPTLVKLDLTEEEQETVLFTLIKFHLHPVVEGFSNDELKENNILIPILSSEEKEKFLFAQATTYKHITKSHLK